jgi:ATP-dependent helicase/nuclease subunit A
MPKWNEDQLRAIEESGKNMLIAAAAGSGKTAVLVERIIRKICDETNTMDVDRLFVVTFTEAAASEMRHRLRDALDKQLQANPGSAHLRRQLALVNQAQISTLHSFCNSVVQKYGYTIGLNPGYRLAKDTEMRLMMEEVLRDLLTEKYEQRATSHAFQQTLDMYTGDRDDRNLVDIILELYLFSRSHPQPEQWLQEQRELYFALLSMSTNDEAQLEPLLTRWIAPMLKQAMAAIGEATMVLNQAFTLMAGQGAPEPFRVTLEEIDDSLARLRDAGRQNWSALQREISGLDVPEFTKSKKFVADENVTKQLRELRKSIKAILDSLKKGQFARSLIEYACDLQVIAPVMDEVLQLTLAFSARLREQKLMKSVLDFSDLEHFSLDILRFPEIAAQYREQFLELYIDEYQDTNRVQEAIVQSLSTQDDTSGNLFMVGDVKQSIYRFRLAEPGLFLQKYESYRANDCANGSLIDLNRNYRSQERILKAVNHIFRLVMNAETMEIEYDQQAELKHGGAIVDETDEQGRRAKSQVELILIDKADAHAVREDETIIDDDTGLLEELGELEDGNLEGRWIATKIRALTGMDGGEPTMVLDKKSNLPRPVELRDIVILARSLQRGVREIADELEKQQIPVFADFKKGYFQAVEVDVMFAVLQMIDNPLQDIPLVGVMRSPMFLFDENELARIRALHPEGYFYDAVRQMAESDDKCTYFLRSLRSWRERANAQSLADTISMVYRDTGYFDFVGTMPGGEQRQANLRALVSRAQEFESTSYRGLFRFLTYIESMRKKGDDMESVRTIGEQENVVRIMSIHSSKGLEYPVVFVARMAKGFNRQDTSGLVLRHKELGIASKIVDRVSHTSYPTMPHMAISAKILEETKAEEMRLFYVALTRARDHLFLLGVTKDAAALQEKWRSALPNVNGKLPSELAARGESYLDWTLMSLAVTSEKEDAVWQQQVVAKTELQLSIAEAMQRESLNDQISVDERGEQLTALLHNRWSWQYPYAAAQTFEAKASVSDLKRKWQSEEEETASVYYPRPQFASQKQLSPAERGSGYHTLMQHVPLNVNVDEELIKETINRLCERELLSVLQAEAIHVASIYRFFQSPLGQRLLSAYPAVRREVPFTYGIPAPSQVGAGETVLVQGIIDCMFEEDGEWVLIDYKTDSTKKHTIKQLTEQYQLQIDTYGQAITEITGKSVKEKHLYFFEVDHDVDVDKFFRYDKQG